MEQFTAMVIFLMAVLWSAVMSGGSEWSDPSNPLYDLLNPSLRDAFIALQTWKNCITDDPNGVTDTWQGLDVCQYKGIFCSPSPDTDSCDTVVSAVDLNSANLAGTLPAALSLLSTLAIFHLNSNRFTGYIPTSITDTWQYLYELDLSNNRFSGSFPVHLLNLPSLVYLDIRFNSFSGDLPDSLFEKPLDALFLNNNQFTDAIPSNLGNSPVSVAVFANNRFDGPIPASIGNMPSLFEILFLNNSLTGCIPDTLSPLSSLTVFDLGSNGITGTLPASISCCTQLEQLNLAGNRLTGPLPGNVCGLPNVKNLTVAGNFFTGEAGSCLNLSCKQGVSFTDGNNCLSNRPGQRSQKECDAYLSNPPSCEAPAPPPPPPSCSCSPDFQSKQP